MLLTLSSALVAVMMRSFDRSSPQPSPRRGEGGTRRVSDGRVRGTFRLLRLGRLLGTVARRDALFLGIFERRFLVHVLQHLAVGLDPVGDEFPVLAVPLLDADVALALVVGAGEPDRHDEPLGAERGDALRRDVEVLVAPLYLLALQGLLAELLLRGADRLEVVDRVDDTAVVERLADLVLGAMPAALLIDVFQDVLHHLVAGAGAVEGAGLVADSGLTRGAHLGLGARPPHPAEILHQT